MFAPISRVAGNTTPRPAGRLIGLICLLFGVVVTAIWHDLDSVFPSRAGFTPNVIVSAPARSNADPDPALAVVAETTEEAGADTNTSARSPTTPAASMSAESPFACDSNADVVANAEPLRVQRHAVALSASADERTRAAGLLLQSRLATDADALAAAVADDASCRLAQRDGLNDTAQFCAETLSRQEAQLLQPGAQAVDRLARLAASTRDPVVYALAYQGCHPPGLTFRVPETGCQLLSVEQWARLDSDNAVPWLHLATQAAASGDIDAADNALRRAATANKVETHTAPDAAAAPPASYLSVVASHCHAEAFNDVARLAVCDALAHVLVSRGRADAEVLAGIQLGERLGWPADDTNVITRKWRSRTDPPRLGGAASAACPRNGIQR